MRWSHHTRPVRRHHHRPLAAVAAGESVVVEHVLFDVVRAQCAAVGVVSGEHLAVLASTTQSVHVRTARGATVAIDRTLAEFIGVVAAQSLQRELTLGAG